MLEFIGYNYNNQYSRSSAGRYTGGNSSEDRFEQFYSDQHSINNSQLLNSSSVSLPYYNQHQQHLSWSEAGMISATANSNSRFHHTSKRDYDYSSPFINTATSTNINTPSSVRSSVPTFMFDDLEFYSGDYQPNFSHLKFHQQQHCHTTPAFVQDALMPPTADMLSTYVGSPTLFGQQIYHCHYHNHHISGLPSDSEYVSHQPQEQSTFMDESVAYNTDGYPKLSTQMAFNDENENYRRQNNQSASTAMSISAGTAGGRASLTSISSSISSTSGCSSAESASSFAPGTEFPFSSSLYFTHPSPHDILVENPMNFGETGTTPVKHFRHRSACSAASPSLFSISPCGGSSASCSSLCDDMTNAEKRSTTDGVKPAKKSSRVPRRRASLVTAYAAHQLSTIHAPTNPLMLDVLLPPDICAKVFCPPSAINPQNYMRSSRKTRMELNQKRVHYCKEPGNYKYCIACKVSEILCVSVINSF